MKKPNWFGVRQLFAKVKPMFSLQKAWLFYFVLGIILYIVHDIVAVKVAIASLICVGGLLAMWGIWEATRFALSKYKQKQIPAFMTVVKQVW